MLTKRESARTRELMFADIQARETCKADTSTAVTMLFKDYIKIDHRINAKASYNMHNSLGDNLQKIVN